MPGAVAGVTRRWIRAVVAIALVAGSVVVNGAAPASAAGFSAASQVQTPTSSLNQRSILVGQRDGQAAPVAFPAGATVASARLYFGAADTGAATVTPLDRSTVLLSVASATVPLAAKPVIATSLETDGGGYRYVADVTLLLPADTTSVTVSGIEGAGASWALLGIYG